MTSSPFSDQHPLKEKRKANKPLLERKRRARINDSLRELKQLVLYSLNKDTSRFSKMEKADILDMTVQFLKSKKLNRSTKEGAPTSYQAGFNECANEIIRFVMTMDEIDHTLKARLLSHLASSCQSNDPSTNNSPTSVTNDSSTPTIITPTVWSSHCLPPSPTDIQPLPQPTTFPIQNSLSAKQLPSNINRPIAQRHQAILAKPSTSHPYLKNEKLYKNRLVKIEFETHYQPVMDDKSSVWRPW